MERRDIRYLIITAGGSGTRMASPVPKQFIRIGGHPILRRTIDRFISYSPDFRIILVLPDDKRRLWLDYCEQAGYSIGPHIIASGGITRFHSVKNALEKVPDGAVVAVHDSVRPMFSAGMIVRLFREAESSPAVVPVIPVTDTLKVLEKKMDADGRVRLAAVPGETADRNRLFGAQTPQIFWSEVLKAAYRQPYSTDFTDDASVTERYGVQTIYPEGEKYNIKITTPDDIRIAEALL